MRAAKSSKNRSIVGMVSSDLASEWYFLRLRLSSDILLGLFKLRLYLVSRENPSVDHNRICQLVSVCDVQRQKKKIYSLSRTLYFRNLLNFKDTHTQKNITE